ncbi:DUF4411 family protein [Tunicatimonas pelagia]|uniref:DUF4411 family protein n=1 Tax=Tunicatimonas pelagia TaxID=931531 RepID=UPI0026657D61|nr:DUF4411 family protein [Tunicatimonas pelagia]WKN41125.1 DUF4411 family protein [Tunicatimonas pelagia]
MEVYCLDTNFFIEGWNKYYSPNFCSDYWDVIKDLGENGTIFVPHEVKKEIDKVDDSLKEWFVDKDFLVKQIDANVQNCLKQLYSNNKAHQYLANNIKGRSLADPWVVAHAMAEKAIVVTKEFSTSSKDQRKVKIPDVCRNMNIECIDDFEFIRRLNIRFKCVTEN